MTKLATFLAIALHLASRVGIAAECLGGDECDATADEDSSLLAVRSVEQRVSKAAAGTAWGPRPRPQPSTQMKSAGEVRTTAFKGASMLCMKFAIPRARGGSELANGALYGEAQEGGFTLQEGEHLLVTVAHFPDAPIGWSETEGSSERVSVPHTLFSVQVPIKDGSKATGQTAYALTDDDTAMNVYRMGENIPAKTATFDLGGASSPTEATGITINRRGVKVLELAGIAPEAAPAGQHEVEDFFGQPTIEQGTGQSLLGNFPISYLQRTTRATSIKSVTKVSIGKVSVTSSTLEKLNALLGTGASLVAAYRVEADLEVSSQAESVTESAGTRSTIQQPDLVNTWRDLGPQTTHMQKDTGRKMAYQDGSITWASFKINRAGIAPYLPPGVTLDSGDAVIWLTRWQPADAKNPWSMLGPVGPLLFEYNELWVEVPVIIHGTKYWFPMVMLLNDDVAMIGGRDNACPKKMADITYKFSPKVQRNAGVDIGISRRGKPVLKMTGRLGAQASSPTPVRGLSDNSRSARPWAMLSILSYSHDPKVWRPSWACIKSVNTVHVQHPLHDVKVELGSDEVAPLGKWFVGQPTDAGYVLMDQDWTMPTAGAQGKPVELEGYQTWWRRNFALLYM